MLLPDFFTDKGFVFGYTATIYHDDETARAIDHGKYLVPCVADSDLLIDRYA